MGRARSPRFTVAQMERRICECSRRQEVCPFEERLADILFSYSCGQSDNEPLPETTADVVPSPKAIATLHAQASTLTPHLDRTADAIVKAEQACFLPLSARGTPLIGAVPGEKGIYVASGHSCWGICNAPGTGKVMSEILVEGKAKSVDVRKLAP